MATDSGFISHKAPYGGMSGLPDAHQRPGTCAISINVDTSQGVIKAREGYTVSNQHNGERVTAMGSVTGHDGSSYIGITYFKSADNTIRFRAIRADGTELGSYNLSAVPYGIPPNPDEYPSIKAAFAKLYISFPRGSVLSYDPNKPKIGPKVVVAKPGTADAAFTAYVEAIPSAACVEVHHQRLWLGGFDGETVVPSSIELPSDQNLITEDYVTDSRAGVVPPRNGLVHSNLNSPETYTFDNFFWMPFSGETIRGLSSTSAGLLVLGESSTCLITGQPGSYVMQTLSQEVGCVSPATVVHGRGVTCWMASDGFYVFNGTGIQRISDDISDMFRGAGWRQSPNREMGPTIADYFFPFIISRPRLKECSGGWDPVRQLFWWSVPMLGNRPPAHRACLVYNPVSGAWSVWCGQRSSGFFPTAFTTIYESGEAKFMFGNSSGQVCVYGSDELDKVSVIASGGATVDGYTRETHNDTESNRTRFTWYWMTHRLEASPNMSVAAKSIRIRQLATGSAGVSPPKFHIDTERAFDQSGTQLSESGTLSSSPSLGPPNPTTPNHYLGEGTWQSGTEAFNWAMPDVWKARYNTSGQTVGHTFRIGLSEMVQDDAGRIEIHDVELEVQPKRDIT